MFTQEQPVAPSTTTLDGTAAMMRVALVGASSVALLYALGHHALRTWDESIYAEVAKEMLHRHSWFTPYWNFRPWFEKPPLLMWATAAMYQVFGVSEMPARITTALSGVATIWLTFEIGRRLMGNWGGFAAAGILLTNAYFVFLSRFGTMDVPLALCCVLAAYGYIRATTGDQRWWYAVGAAVGAGLMLKGPAGILVPVSIGLALVLDRAKARFQLQQKSGVDSPNLWSAGLRNAILLAVVIALPWHLIMVILHGRAFLKEYVGYHVLARMGHSLEGHFGPPYFYLQEYWSEFQPFAVLALSGLCLCAGRRKNSSVVISFLLIITVGFSAVATKLLGYAMPAFPFVVLLAVLGMQELSGLFSQATRRRHAFAAITLLSYPLYCRLQYKHLDFVYGHAEQVAEDSASGIPTAALLRLALLTHPTVNEGSPSPLIVCLDGVVVNSQQLLFYTDRPVIEAFVMPFSMPATEVNSRYFNPVNLGMAVTSRPAPIIIWKVMYPQVAYSGLFDFNVTALSGPLILGQISRR